MYRVSRFDRDTNDWMWWQSKGNIPLLWAKSAFKRHWSTSQMIFCAGPHIFLITCMGVAGQQKDFSTANAPCVPSIHWQAKNLSFVIDSRRLVCFLLQCVLKFLLFKINLQWGQQNLFCSLDALVAVEHSAGANGRWVGATESWAGATGSWAGATKCYEGAAACTSSWCICRCLTNCNRFLSVAAQ